MKDELEASEVETLKSRFRDAGCTVKNIDGTSFEIFGGEFALRTHVFANPFYVQLGTVIFASPHGFLPGRRRKILEYLSRINSNAKLVKFTLEGDRPDPDRGGWHVMASIKFVTGIAGGDYDAAALKNLIMLWWQDIAELVASPGDCELRLMIKDGESDDT
jgi:hypothetical protein